MSHWLITNFMKRFPLYYVLSQNTATFLFLTQLIIVPTVAQSFMELLL